SPSGIASPTPTEDPLSAGTGVDGVLAVSANTTVNTCWPAASASGSSVTLAGGPTPPRLGRRLLVLQAQDDFATAGPTATVTAPARRCPPTPPDSAAASAPRTATWRRRRRSRPRSILSPAAARVKGSTAARARRTAAARWRTVAAAETRIVPAAAAAETAGPEA